MRHFGWLVGLALLPRVVLAAERDAVVPAPREPKNLAGARVGLEPVPVASAFYARLGNGIWRDGAETEVAYSSAFLTGVRGGRVRAVRSEPLVRGRYALRALVGSSVAFSSDTAGKYWGVAGLAGLELQRGWGRWKVGARLAYLPVLFSHASLSGQARDTFAERYPDARDERGPAGVSLWFSGQRVQALLTARALWSDWALDLAGGLELSPLAGRYWANLEQGQLPLLLQVGLARRF